MRLPWSLGLLLAVTLTACDDGEADPPPPDAATAPFTGDLPPLPEGTELNPADGLPVPVGGVWRYRVQTVDWQNPPQPVSVGAETTTQPFDGEAQGLGENEQAILRRTRILLTVDVEGTPTPIRQEIDELLYVRAADRQVGPRVRLRSLTIREREIATGRFVRELTRGYTPAYVLIEDTWKTGILATNYSDQVRLDQSLLERGDEEPQVRGGLITVQVSTATRPAIEPMECRYREGIRRIEVSDSLVPMLTRSYWVEPGVGVVKWQFADTENTTYTLTETNLEPPPQALCPACEDDAACGEGRRCVRVPQSEGPPLGRCEAR